MTLFVAICTLLALVTFGWVLRPLWKARRWPVALAIALLAACTGLLYWLVGTPAAMDPAQREVPRNIEDAIARLEADLARDPTQVEGLRLLARAYAQQQQPVKARDAFARAAKLAPDDPDILVEAAESRARAANDRRFDAAAIAMLEDALRLQPMHQRGRWFLGIALRQRGRDAEAAATWEPLLGIVDANTAAALHPQIDAARADAGLPPLAAPTDTGRAGAGALTVRLRIDPALLQAAPADASVFVIARRPGGPPMPVAVEKHRLSALPATVVLDDADGPMPTQKLSQLDEVEVLARVSASGNAMPQPGDVVSESVRVQLPATQPIELRLQANATP